MQKKSGDSQGNPLLGFWQHRRRAHGAAKEQLRSPSSSLRMKRVSLSFQLPMTPGSRKPCLALHSSTSLSRRPPPKRPPPQPPDPSSLFSIGVLLSRPPPEPPPPPDPPDWSTLPDLLNFPPPLFLKSFVCTAFLQSSASPTSSLHPFGILVPPPSSPSSLTPGSTAFL